MTKKQFTDLAKERGITETRYSGKDRTMYCVAPDAVFSAFSALTKIYELDFKVKKVKHLTKK